MQINHNTELHYSIKKKPIKRIGIFDSGVGGLTVLAPLMKQFPAEYIYIADTAYAPYGNKDAESINERTAYLIEELAQKEIDAIICACHTASTITSLQINNRIPIIGMIDSSISELNSPEIVAIFGTQRTIQPKIYSTKIKERYPQALVHEIACPDLATIIESQLCSVDLHEQVQNYLQPLIPQPLDTIILGCTHYTLIADVFHLLSPHSTIITSHHFAQQFMQSYSPIHSESTLKITQTGNDSEFDQKVKKILNVED